MPFIILGLLVIIAVILYLVFANSEGDPSLKPNPFADLLKSIFVQPGPAADPPANEEATTTAGDPTNSGAGDEAAGNNESATGSSQDGMGDDNPNFKSMEELTEFYRREAEKLTGIKH